MQWLTMKFVSLKTAHQLDLQALHREPLVSQGTRAINQIRAFCWERGIAVRQGNRSRRAKLSRILATPSDTLSPRMLPDHQGIGFGFTPARRRIEFSSEVEELAKRDVGCEGLIRPLGVSSADVEATCFRSIRAPSERTVWPATTGFFLTAECRPYGNTGDRHPTQQRSCRPVV